MLPNPDMNEPILVPDVPMNDVATEIELTINST